MLTLRRHFKGIPLLQFSKHIQKRLQQSQSKPKLAVAGDVVPIFGNVPQFPDRVALRDSIGPYTYANLFLSAKDLSSSISKQLDGKTNQRVLFLCPNSSEYLVTLWAIWMSGQTAVPLSPHHPKNILLYYATDTNASLLITTPPHADLMHRVAQNTNTKLHVLDEKLPQQTSEKIVTNPRDLDYPLSLSFYSTSNALILYTSGTTGNPKGVVLTHKNLVFQVNTLLDAWKWSPNDVILHTLPLHHVHGIINALLCPLYIGAKAVMLPKFDAKLVWSHLLGIKAIDKRVSLYMAVPTIYSKLIDEYERVFSADPKMTEYVLNTLKSKVRLMVSGSAPLPTPIFEKWRQISGHSLLERYGMTETGMCLSNLYDGDREPGFVGLPLPGVSVRIANQLEVTNTNGEISSEAAAELAAKEEVKGELQVKSDGVFKEYFNRPEATKKEFTADGWFKTGDECLFSFTKNKFKILGRLSVDIIKSGGYKLSAVQIETVILGHEDVKECVVVGVEDKEWGERVAAIVILREGKAMELEDLRKWLEEKLPKYSLPTVLKVVEEIPRNAMGKVNKKQLVKNIFPK